MDLDRGLDGDAHTACWLHQSGCRGTVAARRRPDRRTVISLPANQATKAIWPRRCRQPVRNRVAWPHQRSRQAWNRCSAELQHRDDVRNPPIAPVFSPLRRGHAIRGMNPEQAGAARGRSARCCNPHMPIYSRAFRLTPAEARLAVHLTQRHLADRGLGYAGCDR